MKRAFTRFASWISKCTGSPWSFLSAVLLVVGWAAAGPYYGWSDSHSLVINTATTIVNFWMCFVIQHTQNRDTAALQLKLDALVAANEEVNNMLIGIERGTDEDRQRAEETIVLRGYGGLEMETEEVRPRADETDDIAWYGG